MHSRQEVILDLGPLLQHTPGQPAEVAAEGEFYPPEELLAQFDLATDGPLQYELLVTSAGEDDDFILEGTISGVSVAECRRCLEPAHTEVEVPFWFAMEYHPSDEPLYLYAPEEFEDDEWLVFGSRNVDFAELLTQLFALEQPLAVLCKEDCLGLNEDGVNLNLHPELAKQAAKKAKQSSPFAALKDILD